MKQKNFGRVCRFHYPVKKVPCPNCITTASGLSGRYKSGGPIPFSDGELCPYCFGNGIFEESVVEEGLLIVLFDSKMWFEPSKSSMMPDNTALVIGDRTKTWDMIVRAERVVLDTGVYGEGTVYKLFGEPLPVGLLAGDNKTGNRFWMAYLAREGGG